MSGGAPPAGATFTWRDGFIPLMSRDASVRRNFPESPNYRPYRRGRQLMPCRPRRASSMRASGRIGESRSARNLGGMVSTRRVR